MCNNHNSLLLYLFLLIQRNVYLPVNSEFLGAQTVGTDLVRVTPRPFCGPHQQDQSWEVPSSLLSNCQDEACMRTLAKMGWCQERSEQVMGPLVPYPPMDTKEVTALSPLVLLADTAAASKPNGLAPFPFFSWYASTSFARLDFQERRKSLGKQLQDISSFIK